MLVCDGQLHFLHRNIPVAFANRCPWEILTGSIWLPYPLGMWQPLSGLMDGIQMKFISKYGGYFMDEVGR
jgi:hypothetical protein